MVIGDLDFKRISIFPSKTDTPLIVYPYAVLPFTITFQSFQAVPGRYSQIFQFDSILEKSQFPSCQFEQLIGKTFDPFPLPDALRESIPEDSTTKLMGGKIVPR